MGRLVEYLSFLPGPVPAGAYALFVDTVPATYLTALVWRTDAGPDQTLYSATLGPSDGGFGFGFNQSLPAVPSHCGDVLVLQVTLVTDAGLIFEASPTLNIP